MESRPERKLVKQLNRRNVSIYCSGESFSCLSCKHKHTIDECLEENQKIVKCKKGENACFYEESQPFYRHGNWTVLLGCGKSHMRNGCDERMGVFKCIVWCGYDNCNKEIARRPKPIIRNSASSTQSDVMGYWTRFILMAIMMAIIRHIVELDDIFYRLAYSANIATL